MSGNATAYVYNVEAMVDESRCEMNEVVKTGNKVKHQWTITVVAKEKYLADAFVKKQKDYYFGFHILSECELEITAIIPVDYGLGPTLR